MKTAVTSGLRAIVVGGLVAGTLDIGAAALINRVSPVLIAHYIASGVLGKASFSIGAPAAYLGLILQWAMSLIIAAIYWSATARVPKLRERWWLGGLIAGVVIFLVMNFVVMPFSAAPVTLHEVIARFRLAKGAENLLAMLVFGCIVAYCAYYLGEESAEVPSRAGASQQATGIASPKRS
jgi:uncharacterized membrane protein YagU involved in acid resistance